MDYPHLPTDLTSKCSALIERHLEIHKPKLAVKFSEKDTFSFVACHNDLREILLGAVACFKIRGIAWLVAVVASSSYFSVYLLLGLAPVFLAERFFARREREMYICVESIILALEMLATNFAGLGERYPEARDEANSTFAPFPPHLRTRLLDTYLPNRDTSATIWRGFYAQNSN